MVTSLGRTTMTDLLFHLREQLLRDYNVGRIVPSETRTARSVSSQGQYVLRSLKGVLNKLKTPATAAESQQLFLDWMQQLHSECSSYPNGQSFRQSYTQLIGPPPRPPAGGKKRSESDSPPAADPPGTKNTGGDT